MLIVKWKASLRRRKDFDDDVCEFVADRFTGNIRELEGAILKVISYAEIHGSPVTLPLTKEALRSLITPAKT
jgi:chromosomal replication initiator protein